MGSVDDLQQNPPTYLPGDGNRGLFNAIVDPKSEDNSAVFPLDGVELADISDDNLIELLNIAPIICKIGGTTIVRLSQTLALKGGDNVLYSEAETLKFIAINLPDLRVPRVHRAFKVPDEATYFGARAYIVMDYIDGMNQAPEHWETQGCR